MILFLTIYIFKYFFTATTMKLPRECNNVVISSLITFCLNWNMSKRFYDTSTGAATGAAHYGSFVEEGFGLLVASY
jgi:hypothetical protein